METYQHALETLPETVSETSLETGRNLSREITRSETETLLRMLSNSRSANTNKAYARAWSAFTRFCLQQGFTVVPADGTTVALYLDHLNKNGKRASTLSQHIAAISAAHQDSGHGFNYFKHHLVKAALKSAKRDMATDGRSRVSKPRAFTQSEILSMVEAMPSTPQGIRDRALLLLGVNAGLRASEYAALDIHDVSFDEAGMDIRIHVSKTDQYARGEVVYVAGLAPSQHAFDAVKAMRQWLEVRESLPMGDGRLFIAFRKGGSTVHLLRGNVHGITREAITAMVVRGAWAARLPGLSPSSHSLRHSFITQAFSRHLDATRVAKVSRHKNMRTLLEYDQTSRKQNPVAPALWH